MVDDGMGTAGTQQGPVRRHAGTAAAVALVVMWSSGFVGAELGHRVDADPVTLLAWRFLLLSSILGAVAVIRRRPLPDGRAWLRHGVLALLCQVCYLTFVFLGVANGVHGGTAALIAALQPLLVATVAGRLLGERTTLMMWAGMALGLLGVAVVVSGDLGGGIAPAWAYLWPVAGMLSLAGGTVLTRRWHPPEGLFDTILMQSVLTAGILVAVAGVTGRVSPPSAPGFWAAALWLVLLSSLGGYVMYVFVTTTQGATVVSTLLHLTPPTTMLWVFVMFGVPVSPVAIVGMAVSGVGVTLVLRSRRRGRDR